MLGEPVLELIHEGFRVVEQTVDEIELACVEALHSGRERLAGHLRRIAARVVNSQSVSHVGLPTSSWRLTKLLCVGPCRSSRYAAIATRAGSSASART